jgi:pantoate kinase
VIVRRLDAAGACIETLSSSPPLAYVLGRLGITAAVETECRLPIGAGFGLSAAALLATLTAASRSHGLGLSPHAIAALAHEAEVVHRTGLGDVAACQGGGRVVRDGPGIDAPIRRSFDLPGPLCAVSFGPISTPTVLGSREQMARVAAAFPARTPADAKEFFSLSCGFAEASGLLTPEARTVIRRCRKNGIRAGMTMLGNGVFAYGPGAPALLGKYGEVFPFTVAAAGARITGARP